MSKSVGQLHNAQLDERRRGKQARSRMSEDERWHASERIAGIVARSSWFPRCDRIACYLSDETEAGTWSIISRAWRMKKRVFAPVIEKKCRMHFRELMPDTMLSSNRFGLLEPVHGDVIAARHLQVVVTPLVAFDDDRNRIGMGGGYYDRAFAFLKNRRYLHQPKLIGLAFDCQRVEKIIANPWDIRLYQVITESGQVK